MIRENKRNRETRITGDFWSEMWSKDKKWNPSELSANSDHGTLSLNYCIIREISSSLTCSHPLPRFSLSKRIIFSFFQGVTSEFVVTPHLGFSPPFFLEKKRALLEEEPRVISRRTYDFGERSNRAMTSRVTYNGPVSATGHDATPDSPGLTDLGANRQGNG